MYCTVEALASHVCSYISLTANLHSITVLFIPGITYTLLTFSHPPGERLEAFARGGGKGMGLVAGGGGEGREERGGEGGKGKVGMVEQYRFHLGVAMAALPR